MAELVTHNIWKNAVWFEMEAENEKKHLATVNWMVNQIRLMVEPDHIKWMGFKAQAVQMAATAVENVTQRIIKLITAWPSNERLPLLLNISSMKLLFWNCRGTGNNDFRNAMRDLFRDHVPDVVMLMETKIPFVQMGNYFDQFGLTESICVDPNGRVGGYMDSLESR